MKNVKLNTISGLTAMHIIAVAALGLIGGCKSQPAKDAVVAPPPTLQPAAAQPATAQPSAPALVPQAPASAPAAAPALVQSSPELKGNAATYTVQKGDTFFNIAKKYGISAKELADYNKMSLTKPLRLGATLKIPQK